MLMFGPNSTEENIKEECQTDAVGQLCELDGWGYVCLKDWPMNSKLRDSVRGQMAIFQRNLIKACSQNKDRSLLNFP